MRKGDMRVICGIVMLAVLLGLTIPSQAQSYTVWGQVFDEDGITPVDGANVTVTDINTGDSISTTTAGGGYYQVVFGPPATDPVSIGDTLRIEASYNNKMNTTTVSATGSPQKVDLILRFVDTIPPVINYVIVSPSEVSPGEPVHVIVNATDNVAIDVVIASGGEEPFVYLANTAPNIWEGNITAKSTPGIYTVNVSVNDTSDNWAYNSSQFYEVKVEKYNFTVNFVSGYNTFSPPLNDTSVVNASVLMSKIGGGCEEVLKWDAEAQSWKSYSAGMPPIFDFNIKGGEGYFVRMTSSAEVVFSGKGWNSPFTISLAQGYNLIGLPVNDTSVVNASSLISKIGENCTEVLRWDAEAQSWKSYSAGMPPIFDFNIKGGEGYFVNMRGPADVTFEGTPWRQDK